MKNLKQKVQMKKFVQFVTKYLKKLMDGVMILEELELKIVVDQEVLILIIVQVSEAKKTLLKVGKSNIIR